MGADDGLACAPDKDIADEGLALALHLDDVCDLDHGILVCLWEESLATCALDIKAEDAEGRELAPWAFGCMGDDDVVCDIDFDLAVRNMLGLWTHRVLMLWDCDPRGALDVLVDHEAQSKGDVALKGLELAVAERGWEMDAVLENAARCWCVLGQRKEDLQEHGCGVAVEAKHTLAVDDLHRKHVVFHDDVLFVGLAAELVVEHLAELRAVACVESWRRRNVKVRREAVHMGENAVSRRRDAKHSDDGHSALGGTRHALPHVAEGVVNVELHKDKRVLLRIRRNCRRTRPPRELRHLGNIPSHSLQSLGHLFCCCC
eukprot:comp22314_c0_seq1/m.53479 comp22314_c0_seq1/g.53479  ORF comp22314_c0_seq1/g.53479 comp22314_c0_seq1/m.53479 type:complete len:316 (+) comp22314_c0_seq1:2246-3193(+)